VHRRLLKELLESLLLSSSGAAMAWRATNASGGSWLLTEECCTGGGWRITHFDAAMQPTHHEHYDTERAAILALLLSAGERTCVRGQEASRKRGHRRALAGPRNAGKRRWGD